MPLISLVVPAYNEEEVLEAFHREVSEEIDRLPDDFEFVFVDDGSRDQTAPIMRQLSARDPRVRAVILSRNFGHEAAIEAGLRAARGDAVIVMDADLQDGPEIIPRLIGAWREGADVVYAVRKGRKEGRLLRAAFSGFYGLASRVMSIDLPRDAGPFSLMDRQVVDVINDLPEKGRYFPGLRAFAGFRQVPVEAERRERAAGETKYSLVKRTLGGTNAIFSFSKLPLRLMTLMGFLMTILAVAGLIWVIIGAIFGTGTAQGWTSVMTVMFFLAAFIFTFLGILGEYVGKIYDEVRARPNYVVAEEIGPEDPAR
ncbi:MAG: glycosyltransferase family 2 protein [Thermoleophilia bacterium]